MTLDVLAKTMEDLGLLWKGGPGSGHRGHRGRPGKRGGSVPDGTGAPTFSKDNFHTGDTSEIIGHIPRTERWGVARNGFDAANSVHHMPVPDNSDPIPFKESRAESYGGSLLVRRRDNRPMEMRVVLKETEVNYPGLNVVHEHGHYVDLLIGSSWDAAGNWSGAWASDNESLMGGVIDAIVASKGWQALDDFPRFKHWVDSDGHSHSITWSQIAGFLQPHELFARAYAQWIGLRTGNEIINRSLAGWRESWRDGGGPDLQWDRDDFEAIGEAMDKVFGELGLLK